MLAEAFIVCVAIHAKTSKYEKAWQKFTAQYLDDKI
jgi:hypothetical protein